MARRGPTRTHDCPLRGAGKPLFAAFAATALLVAVSLLLQSLHLLPDGGQPTRIEHAPSPPARSAPLMAPGPTPTPAPHPSARGVLVEVVRVVDGDTARVRLDGEEVALRFIGLDTPETVHPTKEVQCHGPEASAEAKRLLPVGAKVRVHYDPTQGKKDKYGRHLVYLTGPGGMDFTAHMIGMGHGREYTYSRKYERQAHYRALQATAKAEERGLWGACAT